MFDWEEDFLASCCTSQRVTIDDGEDGDDATCIVQVSDRDWLVDCMKMRVEGWTQSCTTVGVGFGSLVLNSMDRLNR